MSCFTDSSLVSLAIALVIVCGCDRTQDKQTQSSGLRNLAKPEVAEARNPESTQSSPVKSATHAEQTNRSAKSSTNSTPKTVETSLSIPRENSQQEYKQPLESPAKPPRPEPPATETREPASVADVMAVLNFAEFPRPQDAENAFVFQSSLHYETSADLDTAIVSVSDELLKRGFTSGESIRTLTATVTLKIDDRPMTIFLMNSLDGNATHVSMYHHQGVDVSEVPKLQTNGPIDQRVDQLHYTTPIGVREGQQILRGQSSDKNIPIARMMSSNGIAKRFAKDGLAFVCHVEQSETMEFEYPRDNGSKTTRVYISTQGNVDVANLPRPADFEKPDQAYNAIFGSRKYIAAAKPNDAVQRAGQELQNAGWKPVESIRETIADNQRLFLWNGTLIRVEATEYENDRTYVQYFQSMLSFDLPKDVETRLIRIDSASPRMFFTTSAGVKQMVDFYSQHLPSIGWKPDGSRQLASASQFRQLFEGNYFQPVLLDIQNKDPQTTWVEIRPIDLNALTGVFEDEEKTESETQAETKPETASEDAIALANSADDDAVMPDSAEQIQALARSQIEEALKNVPAEQADEIKKMMENELGELLGGVSGEPATDVGNQATDQLSTPDAEESEIAGNDIDHRAQVAPDGKIAAEDFPVPDGAKNVSREFEMITFGVTEVKKNAQWLTEKLTGLDWKPRGEQMVETDMAYLKFQKGTGTINVTLILDDRNDPPVHAVIQGDGILFADPMPAEAMEYEGALEVDGDSEFNEELGSDDSFDQSPAEFEGLALPEGIESPATTRSQFRSEFVTSVESDLKTVYEFFRNKADESNWKTRSDSQNSKTAAMTLTNDQGEMIVELKKYDGEVEITLAFRNPKLAKEQGFLPPQGKARLILANISKVETIIVINDKTYKLAPEQGAEDPQDGVKLDVEPGTYSYTIKAAGREQQTDKVTVVADGSWGLVVFPQQGHMAERMY